MRVSFIRSLYLTLACAVLTLLWGGPAWANQPPPASPGHVNLNTATEEELCLLPGIGPTKARRILEARAKHKFDSVDQIVRAKGIGRKTFRRLKPYLAVTGPTTLTRMAPGRRDDEEWKLPTPIGGTALPPIDRSARTSKHEDPAREPTRSR